MRIGEPEDLEFLDSTNPPPTQSWALYPACAKVVHHRSLPIFTVDSGIAGNAAMGINFVPFDRRENRRALAIFDRNNGQPYCDNLEDRNLLKLRSLDSSFPFFISDNSIWEQ